MTPSPSPQFPPTVTFTVPYSFIIIFVFFLFLLFPHSHLPLYLFNLWISKGLNIIFHITLLRFPLFSLFFYSLFELVYKIKTVITIVNEKRKQNKKLCLSTSILDFINEQISWMYFYYYYYLDLAQWYRDWKIVVHGSAGAR